MSQRDERLLRLLKDARETLEAERSRRVEPIAIVGLGCRFPGGATGPEAFWRLLAAGGDASGDVPRDRWDADALYDPDPAAAGRVYVKRGSFLEDIGDFEPEFFGITPREAAGLDPQQRLLLEVAWEALEDARIVPDRLRGSNAGVWIGMSLDDYARRSVTSGDLTTIDPYNTLGTARSVAAGRIAYVLDWHGPVMQVDTSCASSLVALHLACQSLRSSECDLALVGGVNLLSSPEATVALCRLGALAPDGRCKTFDAEADGYGRGEGCGVVVLRRLADARKAGDRVRAIVRAVAVNHDGRSNGLTAPNGAAQESVMRAALERGGVEPSAVGYVEAHGTGTPLGDPIEALALHRVYGVGRPPDRPLHVGSVKTNVGHLEGAAGVAGLIKTVLCLEHGQIAPHLHVRRPNPKIPWADLALHVPSEAVDWPRRPGPRIAGVSAFGMSGTNVHVLLEEAPAVGLAPPSAPARPAELVLLSARTGVALEATAARLLDHLRAHPEVPVADVAYSLATARTMMEERAAFVVSPSASLAEGLGAVARGELPRGGARGRAGDATGKVAWIFPGQGAQRLGMGRDLCAAWPAFRDALEAACAAADPHLERPLREVLWADPQGSDAGLLHRTEYTQPALFAHGWALAALWRAWGAEPDFVAGHSIGELVAACLAGVFSLADAARFACARGRLMQALPRAGAMVAVQASEEQVAPFLEGLGDEVALAAVNAPASVVLSGDETVVTAVAERLAKEGVAGRRLVVSHAFHSPLMDPMLEALEAEAATLGLQAPAIPLVSNLTGKLAGPDVATPAYWVRHARDAVRFADGARALEAAGASTFIEMGPKPVLLPLVAQCVDRTSVLVSSARAEVLETEGALEGLGAYVARGGTVDPKGLFPRGGRRRDLPTYPWQRRRFWVDAAARAPHVPPGPHEVWVYSLAWRPVHAPPRTADLRGAWAVVGNAADAQALAGALRRAGALPLSCHDAGGLRRMLAGEVALRGVVFVAPRGARADAAALEVERAVASLAAEAPPRCWWVTRGGVATGPADPPATPEHALVWGLARCFALEHPATWGGILDVGGLDLDEALADRVAALVAGAHGEDQLALRGDDVVAPRLVPGGDGEASRGTFAAPTGTALVTGGLGGLGLHVARWLARRGQRRLLLVGRRGLEVAGARATVHEIEALGAEVTVVAADVTDRDAMVRALRHLDPDVPLTAVFHVAGVEDRTRLEDLTPERLAEVVRAKCEGTQILDELTRGLSLDAFVCFSSIAGVLGSGGQAAYAASNAFLDAWAQAARAEGRAALSVSWGPWAGAGMAADPAARAQLERRGLRPMSPRDAIAALEQALASGRAHRVVADIDWAVYRVGYEAWGRRPLLADLAPAPSPQAASVPPPGEPALDLARLGPDDRAAAVAHLVHAELARIMAVGVVPTDRPLRDLGMDSLMAVELRFALERRLGIHLPATLAFDPGGSSAKAIASRLVACLPGGPAHVPGDGVDLDLEGRLGPDFAFDRASAARASEPTHALLTGATGFLGAFLLSELLAQTKAHVTCLVRARNTTAGLERVARNLGQYGLWSHGMLARVSILVGDLEEPRLGLDDEDYRAVAEGVDAVYNNGAFLSFVAAYDDLRASHVHATREVLRLASTGRPKIVHHVSSVAVYDGAAHRGQPVAESGPVPESRGIHLPYAQCKWVSESLVRAAGARGLPVTVHRPAFIGGSSASGAWNTGDLLCRLLKAFVEMGTMPGDLDIDLDFTPVDYVSRAIIALSRRSASLGGVFHLHHPAGGMPIRVLRDILWSLGYAVTPLPYREWLRQVEERPSGPLYALLPFLRNRWMPEDLTSVELAQRAHRPRLQCRATLAALAAAGIECPAIDRGLMARYLRYFAEQGFAVHPPLASARTA